MQPFHALFQRFLVLLLSSIWVFHRKEKLAGKFGTMPAMIVTPLIDCAIKKRTGFVGHHFLCPERLAFYCNASVAFLTKEFTFITMQAAI